MVPIYVVLVFDGACVPWGLGGGSGRRLGWSRGPDIGRYVTNCVVIVLLATVHRSATHAQRLLLTKL